MPTPLEKASTIIDDINAMIHCTRDVERIAVIEREIALIEKAGHYYQAKQLQGMLAGLCGNAAEVHQKFHAALICSGSDSTVRMNYAQALANVYHIRSAVKQIDLAVEASPDNLNILSVALDLHLNAFDFAGTKIIAEYLSRLGEGSRVSCDVFDKLEATEALLNQAETTWEEVSERVEQAADSVFSVGSMPLFITEMVSEHGILFEFNVLGDVEAAFRIESIIHENIAKQQYSPADRLIAFSCSPA